MQNNKSTFFQKKWITTLLVLIALILFVIAGVKIIQKKKSEQAAIPPAKKYAMVVPVQTAKLSDVRLTMPYLAEIQSDSDVALASKVTARIKSIVSSGTRVKSGDVLVELDAADLRAKKKGLKLKIKEVKGQIKAKQAELNNLIKIHQHSKKLISIQAIPREKYDTEAANIESLKATIDSIHDSISVLSQNILELEDTLSYTVIKSPIAGVVSKTYVAKGGIATGGKPLLSLSGGDAKRLVVRVSDNIKPVALLKDGKPCPLHSLNSTFQGLNEYSCETSTTLPAGNRVEVKLLVYSGKGVLLPMNAVVEINGGHRALIVTRGTQGNNTEQAVPQLVQIKAEGSEGLVVEGIQAGENYVVAKPDILLKLMTGVPIIRARTTVDHQ